MQGGGLTWDGAAVRVELMGKGNSGRIAAAAKDKLTRSIEGGSSSGSEGGR